MRVLMLTQYFPPETGAAQVRLFEIAKAIKAQGHEIEVVTAFPNYPTGIIPKKYHGKFYVKEELEGIQLYRTWIYPAPKGNMLKRLCNYFSFVFSACYGILKAGPADVILVESPPIFIGFTTMFARAVKRAKVIFNVSDLWPETAISLGLIKNKYLIWLTTVIEEHMYRISWRISAQTIGIINTLTKRGIPQDKLVLLPNGVDPELFKPSPPDPLLQEELDIKNKFVILYAGTMGYAAGLDVALKAADKLRDNPDIVFVIVGDGSEKPMLVQMSEEMNLPNVRWRPFQPLAEIVRYYNLASVNLVTIRRYSLADGVRPSKLFPGLASGKPVIYVGEGEGARIASDSGGALLVPAEDPYELVNAILKLKEDVIMRDELGGKGREYVIKHYSWNKLIKDWLQALNF